MSRSELTTPRRLLLTLCLLLFAGCSMLRLGYGQLDTLATWMAHDYFDLEPAQRDAFAQRFERLHDWHRAEQLPEYAQFLTEVQGRAKKGLRPADVHWIVDGFKLRYARIATRAAPDAADLLATLSNEQVEALRRQFDKDNRKFLSEHRSEDGPAERRRVVEKRTLGQLRDWVGPLSDAQETRILALLQAVPPVDLLRHEDRLRRQRAWLNLLAQRQGDRAQFAARVRDALVDWEAGREPEAARRFAEIAQKRAAFYAAVDQLLTPAQRNHLLHRLQDYADDFRDLAARGKPAAAAR